MGINRLSTSQRLSVGVASTTSTAISIGVNAVRLAANVGCHVVIGDGTPVATTADAYLPPNEPESFVAAPGQKVAVIRDTTDGFLTVTELTR